jgi:hypothetical protein
VDVTVTTWRTGNYSGDNGGACIEVGALRPAVAVRDSQDQSGTKLSFSAATSSPFNEQLKTA